MNKSLYYKYASSLYNVLPIRLQHAFSDTAKCSEEPISPQSETTPEKNHEIFVYLLCGLYVLLQLPLPGFVCGLFLGVLSSIWICLLIVAFAGEIIVDDIEEAYFHHKMSKYVEQSVHINSMMTKPSALQEWMTLQSSDSSSRTTVFAELSDDLLVISYPRLSVDPRKVDVRTAEFIQRRKVSVKESSVYLLPSTLSPGRFWSKKHPICLDTTPGPLFYLFFNSQRTKEMWYRRLSSVTPDGAMVYPPVSSVPVSEKRGLPQYDCDTTEDAAQKLGDFMCFMGTIPSRRDVSAEWLNMLSRRMFYHICTMNYWKDRIVHKIEHKFKNMDLPSVIDTIDVKSIEIGVNFPEIVKLHSPHFDEMGLWLDFDLLYGGGFHIQLQTKVNLFRLAEKPDTADEYSPDKGVRKLLRRIQSSSYFKRALELRVVKNSMENIANTPLLLDVEVIGLEGTMTINLPNPPTDRVWLGFRGSPRLHLMAQPKVGDRSINELLCTLVKKMLLNEFEKEAVLPNLIDVIVPLFVPPQVQLGSRI